jgi:hypothetical protein
MADLLSDVADPIGADSRVMKEGGALRARVALGEPFEAVEQDVMGERYHEGKLIGRFADTPAGTELGKFLAPHGLAVDSRGDIYVGEVSWTAWPQIYPGKPHPADFRSLQKFERVE